MDEFNRIQGKDLVPETNMPPPPVQADTDLMELLIMVVDDLCVEVKKLKEKIE